MSLEDPKTVFYLQSENKCNMESLPCLRNRSLTLIVEADKVGEDGPPPVSPPPSMAEPPPSSIWLLLGFMEWHVEVEIAVAKEIGIRHKPFP